jgi:hypothetical protein
MKGDKFRLFQSPTNQLESDKMKSIPYAPAVGSIMYAQVCTCLDLTFIIGCLVDISLIQGWTTGKELRKSCITSRGTRDYMLIYKRAENLKIVGYSDANFAEHFWH